MHNNTQNYKCICGKFFEKKTSLISHHGHCKIYQDTTRDKKQKFLEDHKPIILPNGKYRCQNPKCKKEHDGSYGSGRFCSDACRRTFIGLKSKDSPKHKQHMKRLHDEGIVGQKAPYGTWKCEECNLIFGTRQQLKQHRIDYHSSQIIQKDENGFYCCPYCEKKFEIRQAITGHITNCPNHPNKEKHDLAHKECGKRIHEEYLTGKRVNSFKGKHHSEQAKQHMREATCKYLQQNNPTPCRYNKNSIPILEKIAKEHGWNIQHAENGGEFYTRIGYFVDAYDKEKNVVLEYDEKKHYDDVDNNILRQKDLDRQKQIIEHLHCEYWRYNEETKTLWKVC